MDIDEKIRRGIKLAGWAMLALLLSPLLVVVAVRNLPPTAERQAALAVLRTPTPAVRGRDGSDAAWLLRYDVPAEHQAAVASQVRAYLERYEQLRGARREEEARALKDPRLALAKFPGVDSKSPWLCADEGLGCLAAVRSDPQAAGDAVAKDARGLAAAERFMASDGVRWGLPPSLEQEVPSCACHQRLLRTSYALDFVRGDRARAMSGVCRNIQAWRRLGANTDVLIGNMIGVGSVGRDLRLLSEMLAELPPGEEPPAECASALAPAGDAELGLCPSVRTLFLSNVAVAAELRSIRPDDPGTQALSAAFVNEGRLAGAMAPSFARYCGASVLQAAREDRSAKVEPPVAACSLFERIGDPGSCWFADLAINGDYLAKYSVSMPLLDGRREPRFTLRLRAPP